MRIHRLFRYVAAVAGIAACAAAAGFCAGAGTDGGFLVTQKADAVSVALGEAYTGMTGDLAAVPYNPAGLLGIPEKTAMFSYRQGMSGLKTGGIHVGLGREKQAFAAGVTAFNAGQAEMLDSMGNEISFTTQQDYLATLTYARAFEVFGEEFSLGGNVKYLTSRLADAVSAASVSLDAGASYSLTERTQAGLSVLNIGQGMKYLEETDPLPLVIRGGITHRFGDELLNFDVLQSGNNGIKAQAGFETTVANVLRLRGGYRMGYDSDTVTVGLGLNMRDFSINYCSTLLNPIEPGHVLSITYRP